jgi:uncharacterized protein YecT (DUF1311 family)
MQRWMTAFLVGALSLGTPALALAGPSPAQQAKKDFQAADKELNEVYKSVTTTIGMPASTQKKLVVAELAWLKYRDAEAAFAMDNAQADAEATRYRRLAELTRERTKALWAILNEANGD